MTKKLDKKQFEQHWEKQAEFWSESVRSGSDVFRDLYSLPAFIKFIGNIKGKNILDVACGEGSNTREFARLGAHLTAVDLAPSMIRLAQEEETKNPIGITYQVASWENLPFKENSFDIVLSTMALMDGPGYENAIKEFFRVLKPGGSLFFSITHPCFITPGYSKLTDEHGVCTHRVVTNYFKEGPWVFTWSLSEKPDKSDAKTFTSMSYHRTISTYLNGIIAAGLVLKEIQEPLPTEQACEQNPRLKGARDVAPSFLFVRAAKPA